MVIGLWSPLRADAAAPQGSKNEGVFELTFLEMGRPKYRMELSDDDVAAVLAHMSGDGVPFRFRPSEVYHFDPKDAWDNWENEKHEESRRETANYWSKMSAYVRRRIKLATRREGNPSYCKKSTRNYAKVLDRRSSSSPKFKYRGSLLPDN